MRSVRPAWYVLEGVIVTTRTERRLVLSISLLQRSLAVEVNGDSVTCV